MKPRMKYSCVAYLLHSILSSWTVNAQDKNNHQEYIDSYSGCWEANYSNEERLITMQDKTFQWINRASSKDTLQGKWRISSRMGIPFKATVIILKFSNGTKEIYGVSELSMPIIYMDEDRRLSKVVCSH